jgi:hypothetical protein
MDSQERRPQSDDVMVGDDAEATGAGREGAVGPEIPRGGAGEEARDELGASDETGAGISARDADREDAAGGGGRPRDE